MINDNERLKMLLEEAENEIVTDIPLDVLESVTEKCRYFANNDIIISFLCGTLIVLYDIYLLLALKYVG